MTSLNGVRKLRLTAKETLSEVFNTVEPRFYRHPLNTDTSLLRTVFSVPGKEKSLHSL